MATEPRIGSWSVDLATGELSWSEDFYRLLGLDPRMAVPSEELFFSVVHEDDLPAALAALEKLRENPEPLSMEYRIRRPDGAVRWLRGYVQLARDADGHRASLQGALEDITDAAAEAEAIAVSEQQLRAITTSTLDAIVTFRPDGVVTGWNPAATALYGYREEEILGRDVRTLVPERLRGEFDDAALRLLRELARTGVAVDLQVVRRDGIEVPVEVTISTWEAGGESFITAFARDISKRRSAEERLAREHRLLFLLEGVATAANATDRLEDAAAEVLRLVCRATGWDLGHLLVVEGSRLSPTGVWHVERDPERYVPFQVSTATAVIRTDDGVAGLAFATRSAQWIEGGTTSDLWPVRAAAAEAVGLRSGFAMPVLIGDEVVAVLELFSPDPGDLTDADFVSVMGAVGTQLGRVVERQRAAAAERRTDARFRSVVERSADIVTIHGPDARVLYVSPSVERVLGHRPESLIGTDALGVMHPSDRPSARMWFLGVVENRPGAGAPIEVRLRHADGTWRTVEGKATNLLADPTVEGVVVQTRDLTRERAFEAELAHARVHDPLTGLPMRQVFLERLARALARATRQRWSTVVCCIDIDHLRDVNDAFGHAAADGVLMEVARRLESALHDRDATGRIFDLASRAGSDEFYLLAEDVGADEAPAFVSSLSALLSAPMRVGQATVHVSVGIGAVVAEAGADDAEAAAAAADSALRHAKLQGLGGMAFFDDEMRISSSLRTAREGALRLALERQEFRLLYQPKISLLRDQVVGVEALLRWEHPDDGPVPPLEFIPHAEASGLIVPIGAWVLREACMQAAAWAALRPSDPLSVSVNVSARQFDAALVATVQDVIASSGIDARLVCLEVTESVLMTDPQSAAKVLAELKRLGVSISIDDFGTGYSSLAYLKRFPIDELKIDRAFVNGLGDDPEDTAIVAAVIAMAHALDVAVVAEGVETAAQLERLRQLGSDQAQGYLFAKPQPSAAIDALLNGELTIQQLGSAANRAVMGPLSTAAVTRVLVVDDSDELRGLARLNLTTAGFETFEARSFAEAMEAAKRVRPACVLLDLDLGAEDGENGLDLCRALRLEPLTADVTIVIVTASAARDDRVRAFALGADDYILKPFSPRDLLARVRAAMSRSTTTPAR